MSTYRVECRRDAGFIDDGKKLYGEIPVSLVNHIDSEDFVGDEPYAPYAFLLG